MNRRNFLTYAAIIGGSTALSGCRSNSRAPIVSGKRKADTLFKEMKADVIVVGGGIGGCATALACCRNGLNVIMTEETACCESCPPIQTVSSDRKSVV